MKRSWPLYGSADEIYLRATEIVEEMIISIIKEQPNPIEQKGEVVRFRRRNPTEGNIENLIELQEVFDYIRMLDAEGYPKAFLETKHFRLEFERASLKYESVEANVRITKKM